MPWKLPGSRPDSYQSPSLVSMMGHRIPHERNVPSNKEIFIRYGQIIPTPIYIVEKSKKNLKKKKSTKKKQLQTLFLKVWIHSTLFFCLKNISILIYTRIKNYYFINIDLFNGKEETSYYNYNFLILNKR